MQFVIERTLFGIHTNELGWILIAIAVTGLSILAIYYILHDIWLQDIQRSCEDETETEEQTI